MRMKKTYLLVLLIPIAILMIFVGAFYMAWGGEPGLFIGGCIILTITLFFFIIPRFTAF